MESKQETASLSGYTPDRKQRSIGVQGEDHCSSATGHTLLPTLSDLISRRTSSDSDHSSKKDASTGESLGKSQPLQSSVPSLANLMKSNEGMGCGRVPSSDSTGSVGRVPLQKPTSSTPTLSDLIRQSSPSSHPPGTKRDSTSVRGETAGISLSLNDVIQSRQTSQSSAMQLKTPLAKEQNTGDVVENVESSVLSLSDLMKENRIMRDERFDGNERGKSTISPQDRSQLCSGIIGGDSSGTSPSLSDLMKSNEQLTVGGGTEQVSTGKYTSMSKSEDSPSLSDLMSLKKQPLVSADYVQLASAKQSESEAEKSSPSLSDLIRSSKQQSAIVAVMKSSPGKREERESLGNSPSLSSLIASSKQKSSSDQPHMLAVKTRDISGTSPSLAELMKKDKPGIAFDEKLASQLEPVPLLDGQMEGRGTAGTLTPKVAAEPSTSSKLDTRAIQPLIPGIDHPSNSSRLPTTSAPSLADLIHATKQTSNRLKTPLAKEQNTGDVVENVESSVLSLSDLMKENRIMRDERFDGNERGKSTISPQDRSQLCSGIIGGDSSGTSPSLSDLMKSNEQLTVGGGTEQVSTGKYTSMSKSEDSPSLSDLMSLKKQPLVSADYVQLASAKQSESEAEKSSPSLSDLIRSSKQQSAIVAVMKSSPGKREERESLGNSPSVSSLIASSKQKSSSDQPHMLAVKTRDISGTAPSLAELMKKDKPGIAFDEKLASQLEPVPLLVNQMEGRGTAGTLTPKVAAEPSTSSKLDTRAIQPLIPGIDHPSNSSRLPTTSAPSLADLIHANKQTSNRPTGLASVANISSSEPPPKSTPFTHHDLKLLLRKQQIPIEEETPKYHVQDVVVVLPSNTTPTAVIMSRRCCGSHDMRCAIEATAVKTLLADWYCGDLQPFSFTTPSPDDFVLSKQKGHL